MRKTLLLDDNIYNELSSDVETRTRLTKAIADGLVRVIVTPVVANELAGGPFGGVPDWFPVDVEIESVAVLGYARLGMARLGSGGVYTQHRGESNKIPDAIIAASANELADVLATNDRRCRKRLSELSTTCLAMDYVQFRTWLSELHNSIDSAI